MCQLIGGKMIFISRQCKIGIKIKMSSDRRDHNSLTVDAKLNKTTNCKSILIQLEYSFLLSSLLVALVLFFFSTQNYWNVCTNQGMFCLCSNVDKHI